MAEVVVMVTTSYPRFPGDSVGTFMEPIATSVAARGHEVHVVAPWHPLVTRPPREHGVQFHFYKYAPVPALNVFGYAGAMRADVSLRGAAYLAAPFALAAGLRAVRRVVRAHRATVVHGHWVVPGGFTAAIAAPSLPLVVSLHGSDVYIAERLAPARMAARHAFARAGCVTACSADLANRAIAIGAAADRMEVVPYGVDVERFRPNARAREQLRQSLGVPDWQKLVFTAGRLVRKKGFEYLIDALDGVPDAVTVIAGEGTLADELRARATALGVTERVRFLGNQNQQRVAELMAAADVIVVPSVKDDSGNVDGLPNVVMEALASGTPLVATPAGGIGSVVGHGETARVVPERDAAAIAREVRFLFDNGAAAAAMAANARTLVATRFGWADVARRFEEAYARAIAFKSLHS